MPERRAAALTTPSHASFLPTEASEEQLPAPRDVLAVRLRDGETIAARRHGRRDGPRVVLSHGNGMAIDLYFPFWKHFLERFEVIVHDVRNHGWNPLGDPRRHQFASFVFDNEALLDAIDAAWGPKPALGVFHSLSAITALHHALRVGPRWAGLVLVDPPLVPPLGHRFEGAFLEGQERIAERTARRQERYGSYHDFEAVLRRAPAFEQLVDECFPLYAASTLRPAEDGEGYVLRCPRELEARTYLANLDSTIALAMGGFPSPLKVLGGDPERVDVGPPSLISQALFSEWGVEYEAVPGTGHFLQLERPRRCAELVEAYFSRLGLG